MVLREEMYFEPRTISPGGKHPLVRSDLFGRSDALSYGADGLYQG